MFSEPFTETVSLSLQVMICRKDLSVLNMSSKHGSFLFFSECKTICSHHKSLKNRWAPRRKWGADCPACHSTQPVSHLGTNLVVFVMCTHFFLFVCLVELHPMHCFATCFPFNVSKTSPHIFQCVIGCRATHIKAQGFKIIIVFRGQIFKDMEEWTLFLKRQ